MESSSMTTTTDSGGAASSSSPTNNNHNSSSTESLNGLKFGRKIYFEQEAGGASGSTGSTKKQRAQAHNQPGQPPRCQVEGCNVDLSDVKAYYSRHKVCAMHSKTPTVVVGGIQQRFCQQCSRFHQLPEFDQGKRSCRRRLAGHNERRRKPQPGSMLSQCYGRLSSSIYDNSSRVGGILMDFSACPGDGRDAWTAARTSERPPGNQIVTATGKFLQYPWQSNPENARSDLFQHGSSGGYPGPGIPPGECVTGVTDSRCALSLLSSQPWDSRNRGVETNGFMNTHGPPTGQSVPNVGTINPFPTPSWGFKGNEAGSSSHQDMLPDLGLGQISQPLNGPYSGELDLSQQGRRQQNMDLGNLRGYSRGYDDSSQQNNWSL